MSWLSLPLPNPFKSLQSDEHQQTLSPTSPSNQTSSHGGGVKDDLSVLGQTIGRQLRGVASFLAPQPPACPPAAAAAAASSVAEDAYDNSSSQRLLGIRNDLVEIGGSFKSGLSRLSTNKAVSEISRLASNLLQFQNEDDGGGDRDDEASEDDDPRGGIAGVTDEVIDFVQEISMRPECWIDFPLSLDNDFNLSDAQREHASTVERLAPSFAALRLKLCSCISDEQFWVIYFILLLPRLNEHDSKLLATPEIVEARNILLQQLQNKRNAQVVSTQNSKNVDPSQEGGKANDTQGENSPSQDNEVLAETENAARGVEIDEHQDTEQWLEEEDVDVGTSLDSQKHLEDEEDVSFSDLENDNNDLSSRRSGFRSAQGIRVSSPNGSNEWVQLNENSETRGGQQKTGQSTSQGKDSEDESNDWLTVDDFD